MSEIRKDPLGNTLIMHGTSAENDEICRKLEARLNFSLDYARSKGWPEDPKQLTIQQILEIRQNPGWEKAGT